MSDCIICTQLKLGIPSIEVKEGKEILPNIFICDGHLTMAKQMIPGLEEMLK